MKKIFILLSFLFAAGCIQLQAQTTEPQPSSETQAAPADAKPAMKCCAAGEKAGCCKTQGKTQTQKSKKGKKNNAMCCASSGSSTACCAHGNNDKHGGKPCHPGCTMPCCTKKE